MVDFDTDGTEDGREPPTDGSNVVSTPTVVQDPYIQEHKTARMARDAHPVDKQIVETAVGDSIVTIDFDLAAIQAVADSTRILNDDESVRLLKETEELRYYQVDSALYYQLAAKVDEKYGTYIHVEDLVDIMEAQTRQFLNGMHDWTGEFEHSATLCDAVNSPTCNEGAVCHETEPEDAHYGFVDARGLVVQRGTHS